MVRRTTSKPTSRWVHPIVFVFSADVVTIGNGVHYLNLALADLPIRIPHINTQGLKEPGVGTSNSVQTFEGPSGVPTLYMATGRKLKPLSYQTVWIILPVKTSLFHPDGMLLEVLRSYGGFRNDLSANSPVGQVIGKAIRGLLVLPTHEVGCEETYKIRRLGSSSRDHKFEHGGSSVSVVEYFNRKYKITIQFPHLFTVEVSRKGKAVHYPVELLKIAPNQTVTNDQMIGSEQADMIRVRMNTVKSLLVRHVLLCFKPLKDALSLEAPY